MSIFRKSFRDVSIYRHFQVSICRNIGSRAQRSLVSTYGNILKKARCQRFDRIIRALLPFHGEAARLAVWDPIFHRRSLPASLTQAHRFRSSWCKHRKRQMIHRAIRPIGVSDQQHASCPFKAERGSQQIEMKSSF